MNYQVELISLSCPYCGEEVELLVDASIELQDYVEDCAVCCRPIALRVSVDREGQVSVQARSEDE